MHSPHEPDTHINSVEQLFDQERVALHLDNLLKDKLFIDHGRMIFILGELVAAMAFVLPMILGGINLAWFVGFTVTIGTSLISYFLLSEN